MGCVLRLLFFFCGLELKQLYLVNFKAFLVLGAGNLKLVPEEIIEADRRINLEAESEYEYEARIANTKNAKSERAFEKRILLKRI